MPERSVYSGCDAQSGHKWEQRDMSADDIRSASEAFLAALKETVPPHDEATVNGDGND